MAHAHHDIEIPPAGVFQHAIKARTLGATLGAAHASIGVDLHHFPAAAFRDPSQFLYLVFNGLGVGAHGRSGLAVDAGSLRLVSHEPRSCRDNRERNRNAKGSHQSFPGRPDLHPNYRCQPVACPARTCGRPPLSRMKCVMVPCFKWLRRDVPYPISHFAPMTVSQIAIDQIVNKVAAKSSPTASNSPSSSR
jgi:hypothetical protein